MWNRKALSYSDSRGTDWFSACSVMGPFSTDRGHKTERPPDLIYFLRESFYEEMKLVKPECRDLLKDASEMQSTNPRFSFGEKNTGQAIY